MEAKRPRDCGNRPHSRTPLKGQYIGIAPLLQDRPKIPARTIAQRGGAEPALQGQPHTAGSSAKGMHRRRGQNCAAHAHDDGKKPQENGSPKERWRRTRIGTQGPSAHGARAAPAQTRRRRKAPVPARSLPPGPRRRKARRKYRTARDMGRPGARAGLAARRSKELDCDAERAVDGGRDCACPRSRDFRCANASPARFSKTTRHRRALTADIIERTPPVSRRDDNLDDNPVGHTRVAGGARRRMAEPVYRGRQCR